ncbi:MAG: hypothetical protein WCJ72_16970, partial [Chryseobacterium sp.]
MKTESLTHKNTYKYLTLLIFFLFITFQTYKAFNVPSWRDDAFFAGVAKNLVLGNGYSGSIFNQLGNFHVGITVGPVVILPAALMIKIFGNDYWVPSLTSVILITICFIIILYQL